MHTIKVKKNKHLALLSQNFDIIHSWPLISDVIPLSALSSLLDGRRHFQ